MATPALHAEKLEEFRKSLRGTMVQPGDDTYEELRRVWNGMIDKRPAVIARCAGSADVMASVRFARQNNLPIAVRGGGHNVAGTSVCDGGIVIDLAPMRDVRVDRSRSVVRVGGGSLLGDVDHEAQAFGMAVPVGVVPATGIGGLSLHGGLGFLTRKYGLTADNLVSADVVTAQGELITADENTHQDLLWALKGGGGNFGVVTSFEFQCHPVGPQVWFLLTHYPAARAREVIEAFRSFMPGAPEEFMAMAIYWNAPEEASIPEEHWGSPVVTLVGCWCGPVEEGERITQPLREITTPVADLSGPMPYREVQRLFEHDYPDGLRYYWKAMYVQDLSDDAIELFCDAGGERPTPVTTVELWALGGAMARVRPEETAFFHREAPFLFNIEANWEDPATDEANISWVRKRYQEAMRFSQGGTYLNFGGFLEEGEKMLVKSFGTNYQRIKEVKAQYDPENIFHHNLRIPTER